MPTTTTTSQASAAASAAAPRAPAGKAVIYLRVSTMRQATKGGEAEGYSIPAQRAACHQKAKDLGLDVVEEFVDAGQSARSADRPELHAMLSRIKQGDISTLIVHKSDRLARSLEDHVAIVGSLKKKGVALVSCMEIMDADTPSGILTQGIMAAFNEFYSSNLSFEAKKGMRQKAQNGGTPGKVPIGYLNITSSEGGKDIRTVAVDEERAAHITWAFQFYATGQPSIAQVTAELKKRGLTSRPTAKTRGKALSNAQVHRLLHNKYYRGIVTYDGVDYPGRHAPLVDALTFQKVQELLDYRRINGDRSWRHKHHLKGIAYCGRCGSKMGYGPSKGKSGHTYEYFFCLGRHTGRKPCDLPYLLSEDLEQHVLRIIETVQFDAEYIAGVRALAHKMLDEQLGDYQGLQRTQAKRLKELETKKQRLYDAYLEAAIPVAELKKRQEAIETEIVNAQALLDESTTTSTEAHERLDTVLDLLGNVVETYHMADGMAKHMLLQAMLERIDINIDDDSGDDAGPSQATVAEIPATVGNTLETARQVGAPVAFPGQDAVTKRRTGGQAHSGAESRANGQTRAHHAKS